MQKKEKPIVNGFVYFAYTPISYEKGIHHIKIGQTKNLESRLSQLQTGNPYPLVFYKTHQSFDYKKIEKELHQKYKAKKVLNEWFNITLEDVDNELKLLSPEVPGDVIPKTKWSDYLPSFSSIKNIFSSILKRS